MIAAATLWFADQPYGIKAVRQVSLGRAAMSVCAGAAMVATGT
jgi:VIT1/CCC1 family predicted Fe2+/Mn2+ transporter